ncbi:MAG: SpoIIE family protein phosphatase [Thermoguttaceae bacterium]|nr:SpoIIE family protein phosphatase [Thermoguttaceae bacterium]
MKMARYFRALLRYSRLFQIILRPFAAGRGSSRVTLRRRFLRVFYLYAAFSLLFSTCSSILFEYGKTMDRFERASRFKIDELRAQTKNARATYDRLLDQMKRDAVDRADAISRFIALQPELLSATGSEVDEQTAGLGKLAKERGVAEISALGEDGVVFASYPTKNIGTDFHTPPMDEFLRLLERPDEPVAQDIRFSANAPEQGEFMYVGVSRKDAKGLIQIGIAASPLRDLYRLGAVDKFLYASSNPDNLFAVFDDKKRVVGDPVFDFVDFDAALESGISTIKTPDGLVLVRAERNLDPNDGRVYLFGLNLSRSFKQTVLAVLGIGSLLFLLLISVFFGVSYLLNRFIVESVYKLNRSLDKIARGDLEEKVDVRSSLEFSELSDGVNATVSALKDAMESIRARSEEELTLAQKIQAAVLPDVGKRYARDERFDVFAVNRPMRHVGGDVYDFFFVSETDVFFYVADVSGHGVAAALVTMKTMALVKNLAMFGCELSEVVERTNQYLSETNDSMFVTGFFCRLDLTTGRTEYANAGHNPPFLRRKGGRFEPMNPEINMILGVNSDETYVCSEFSLEPGDELALYTDGITEATAPGVDCFESRRALATLNAAEENEPAKATAERLFAAIAEFTGTEEPSDDETLLLFKMRKFARKRDRIRDEVRP